MGLKGAELRILWSRTVVVRRKTWGLKCVYDVKAAEFYMQSCLTFE